MSREVHKAEWQIKEQKLKDDIRGLHEKLTGLDKENSLSEQSRYSLIDAELPQLQRQGVVLLEEVHQRGRKL